MRTRELDMRRNFHLGAIGISWDDSLSNDDRYSIHMPVALRYQSDNSILLAADLDVKKVKLSSMPWHWALMPHPWCHGVPWVAIAKWVRFN